MPFIPYAAANEWMVCGSWHVTVSRTGSIVDFYAYHADDLPADPSGSLFLNLPAGAEGQLWEVCMDKRRRGQGGGDCLISAVLTYCKAQQIERLTGELSDVDDWQRLRLWYTRRGFEVMDEAAPRGHIRAQIAIQL